MLKYATACVSKGRTMLLGVYRFHKSLPRSNDRRPIHDTRIHWAKNFASGSAVDQWAVCWIQRQRSGFNTGVRTEFDPWFGSHDHPSVQLMPICLVYVNFDIY